MKKTKLLAGAAIGVLAAGMAVADSVYWVGGSGSWMDSAKWTNAVGASVVPTNSDVVMIGSGTALLTSASAELASFTMTGGTLSFSNWTTRLNATNITIQTGAVVTIISSFTEAVGMSNRIDIACTDFTLDAGGLILADGKGYAGGAGHTGTTYGPGKGTSADQDGSGAGYGGVGGISVKTSIRGGTYGTTNEPTQPGSGGGGGWSGSGGAGGGAVRIDASGVVALNGTIRANGVGGVTSGGGGSGGAVYISCATLSGTSGVIQARGGAPGRANAGGGGGGRISVVYSTFSGIPGGLVFSTSPAEGYIKDRTAATASRMGTLYLSSTNPLADIWKTQIQDSFLNVPGFTTYSDPVVISNATVGLPDGFAFNGASVRVATVSNGLFTGANQVFSNTDFILPTNSFFQTGTNLSMTCSGNLTLSSNATLRIGSNSTVDCSGSMLLDKGIWIQDMNPTINCAGNLTLTNAGLLHVYSGPTNSIKPHGGQIGVTGDVTIAATSWIYPYSEPNNGGAVKFKMNRLFINANAGINADAKGYSGSDYTSTGKGPGGGVGGNQGGGGGGHGGKGGLGRAGSTDKAGGIANGLTNAPVSSGSGGGGGWSGVGGIGGGVVRIDASSNIVHNGTISANGQSRNTITYPGGGAGGSVFINCSGLSGTGTISAIGGMAHAGSSTQAGGGGGGGRISVVLGLSDSQVSDLIAGAPIPGLYPYTTDNDIAVTFSKTAGTGYVNVPTNGAEAGSLVFIKILSESDWGLTVAGNPSEYGSPSPNAYGGHLIANETLVTNSVVTPANSTATQRWACIGWSLLDEQGILVDSNTTAQAVFTMNTNLTLVWTWTNEYYLAVNADSNGVVTGSGWYTNGTVASITATAGGSHSFMQWDGDIPAEQRYTAATTLIMNQPRTVAAAFPSLTGEAKTWTGGTANWTSRTNWTPEGVPGAKDVVLIAAGAVTLNTTQAVASLTITNATLTFSNWETVLEATTVTIERLGLLTLPSAFTTSQMSNRVHVVCTDMTIKPGGSILADAKGYAGGESHLSNGYGPGAGTGGDQGGGGGGHGGKGGIGRAYTTERAGGIVSGQTNAPVTPGSGAGGGWTGAGGAGGGAVRIDALRTLVQDGTISANGESRLSAFFPGGGAGGSIFINCSVFSGSGTNRANGGTANPGSDANAGGGGGGGRIAVWIKVSESQRDQYLAGNPGNVLRETTYTSYAGVAEALHGTGWRNPPDASAAGAGTVYFFIGPPQSTLFLFR
jgi:hypothetical protein